MSDWCTIEPADALNILNPADWEGIPIPPREWIVESFVPAKTVTLLIGDGATGKSTLGLQLCAARALRRQWLSTVPTPGRSLYLSAEDDADELHRRLDAIRGHFGASFADLADMHLADLVGANAVLGEMAQNGIIQATPLYKAVVDYVQHFRPNLVVVDALADVFAGDENNRAQARQFISMLKRPGRTYGCAFLALAHPSLSGMSTGRGTSGSTGWSNSVRSRLYFESAKASDDSEPDPNLRTLTVKKSNYGPAGLSMTIRWQNGVYVLEKGHAGTGWLDKMARDKGAEETFLSLLTKFNRQNRDVSPNKSNTYAPAVFATEAKAQGITSSQFAAAMSRLFEAGKIRVETFGPPSRQRSRLVSGSA